MVSTFLTSYQSSGSVAFLGAISMIVIFGLPEDIGTSFVLIYLGSLFTLTLNKFNLSDQLVKRYWISKRLSSNYELHDDWINNYLTTESSKPVFEKINSEFYFGISFWISILVIYREFDFTNISNMLLSLVLFAIGCGLIYKGYSTGKSSYHLIANLVRFELYRNEYSNSYNWIDPTSTRIERQNKIYEERKTSIEQLEAILSRKDYVSFNLYFINNIERPARSNGEKIIRKILGPEYFDSTKRDVLNYYTNTIRNFLSSTIDDFYKSSYAILNKNTLQISPIFESIAQKISEKEEILELLDKFSLYLHTRNLSQYAITNIGDRLIEGNTILLSSDEIDTYIQRSSIKQVGESQSEELTRQFFQQIFVLVRNLHGYYLSDEPIKIEFQNTKFGSNIQKILIPRQGTDDIEIPYKEFLIWIYNQNYLINGNSVYSYHTPGTLDSLLKSFEKFIDPNTIFSKISEIQEILMKIIERIFPDFMDYNYDYNPDLTVYDHKKFQKDLNKIFKSISDDIRKIEELSTAIHRLQNSSSNPLYDLVYNHF